MEVIGEAADWFTTLVEVPISRADMLLVDWDLLPIMRPMWLWMDFEKPAHLRWLLSLSAIWTLVSKPHSPLAPMYLSAKVRRLNVWPNICESPLRVFLQQCHLADSENL